MKQHTRPVGFRIRPDVYKEMAKAAEKEMMPVSEWIRKVIVEALKGKAP